MIFDPIVVSTWLPVVRHQTTEASKQQSPIFCAKNVLIKHVTTTCGSVVIIGETARRRLPGITEFLIDAGSAKAQYILCSQRRRIAAVTVATYMARQSIITTSN